MRFGTGGRGGRRFQVLALVLTYVAVSLAYSILAVRAGADQAPTETAGSTTTGAAAAPAAAPSGEPVPDDAPAAPGEDGEGSFALSLLLFVFFCLALPVLVIVDSLPGGLISAAIIVFGMLQAWRMTGKPVLTVTGPYRVGSGAAAAAAV